MWLKSLSKLEPADTLRRLSGSLNFWLLAVYFIGFGVYFVGMPKYIDDYWHIQELRPWFEAQGLSSPEPGGNFFKAGIPWEEIQKTWQWRLEYDNLRLTTLLVVFFLMMPKWVGSLLSLGFWIYAVVRGLRLVGIDVLRSPLVPVAMAVYYVLIPWSVCLGSLTFQFSYLVASGLSVWLFMRLTSDRSGLGWNIGTMILGLITGLWHEGFGAPLACGVIALLFIRRRNRTGTAMCLAGLIAGTLFNVVSAGLQKRGGHAMSVLVLDPGTVFSLIRQEWMWFGSMALLVIGLFSRKWREKNMGKTWIWYMLPVCVCSLLILMLVPEGARVGWACAFFSVPWGLGILRTLLPGLTEKYNVATTAVGVALCGVMYAGLALTGSESLRIRELHKRLVEQVVSHPEQVAFFVDYRYMNELSPLMLGMPASDLYTTGMRFLSNYYREGEYWQRIYCVPEELEYVTEKSGETIPGEGGFRRLGNKYFAVCPEGMTGLNCRKVTLDFGKGKTNTYCMVGVFTSKADGKNYIFMEPVLDWYVAHFKTIRELGKLYQESGDL